jgi:hypothetical protein
MPALSDSLGAAERNARGGAVSGKDPERMSEDTWSGSDDTSASDFYPAIDSDDEDNETSYYGMGANEGAEHADAFAAGLRRLLEPSRVTSPPLLRAIVETEVWHVPVLPEGRFLTTNAAAGRYRRAIEAEPQSVKGKRRRRDGEGGVLLPVYAREPAEPSVMLDGRALVRAIPDEVNGLLLYLPERAPRELGTAHFPLLRGLAEAAALEAMLAVPAPGQAEALLRANWWVEKAGDGPAVKTTMEKGRLIHAYTHPERAGNSGRTVAAVTGEVLFRYVVGNPSINGILVNCASITGWGAKAVNHLALSPAFAHRILAGEDIRPGVAPLAARCRGEAELWLHFRRFPWEGREFVENPVAEGVLLRAKVPQGGDWRMQETLGTQRYRSGPIESPAFLLPPPAMTADTAAEPGFGAGPSRILCPGLLARELNAGAFPHGADPARYGRRGRWLILGRLVSAWEQEMSRRRLALATELAKLLPPDADRIPHAALLTVEGAAFLAEHPHGGSRAWIEETVRQAERYTKRWVWGR